MSSLDLTKAEAEERYGPPEGHNKYGPQYRDLQGRLIDPRELADYDLTEHACCY